MRRAGWGMEAAPHRGGHNWKWGTPTLTSGNGAMQSTNASASPWADSPHGNIEKRWLHTPNRVQITSSSHRLPSDVVDVPSLETFKARLDKVLGNLI